jgi:branched chain amino acid efflux pump
VSDPPPHPDPSASRAAFLTGVIRCAPVALGTLAYGLVFGALTGQAGLTLSEATLMSLLVFAGSAQFVALGLWALPPPVAAIAATTFLINFRYFLMATTMERVLAGWPRGRALAAMFLMADENWALTMAAGERTSLGAFYLGASLLLYAAWVAATVLGHLLGTGIADPKRLGLDFAFTAMFLALAVALGKRKPQVLVWIVSAATALIADRLLGGSLPIILGGLAGAGVAALKPNAAHAR